MHGFGLHLRMFRGRRLWIRSTAGMQTGYAPLPIGEGQTISQPFVVALMTQAVDRRPGEKTLEIGTGSGFQTAILCELVRAESCERGECVYSVERHASLAERALACLTDMGYAPNVRTGDGAAGWPEAAPFRAIIVTAAALSAGKPVGAAGRRRSYGDSDRRSLRCADALAF